MIYITQEEFEDRLKRKLNPWDCLQVFAGNYLNIPHVYINGVYYTPERLLEQTGMDIRKIKIREPNNLELWKNLVRS